MGSHKDFRTRVENLREAWKDLKLTDYDFYVSRRSFQNVLTLREKWLMICPDNIAGKSQFRRHRDKEGIHSLFYAYWIPAAKHFNNLPRHKQEYLIRKYELVKIWMD